MVIKALRMSCGGRKTGWCLDFFNYLFGIAFGGEACRLVFSCPVRRGQGEMKKKWGRTCQGYKLQLYLSPLTRGRKSHG